MLAYNGVILNGYRERVIQHPIALGKRYAVLLDVCCVLLRIEFGGHKSSICTICISVNAADRRLGGICVGLILTIGIGFRALPVTPAGESQEETACSGQEGLGA